LCGPQYASLGATIREADVEYLAGLAFTLIGPAFAVLKKT